MFVFYVDDYNRLCFYVVLPRKKTYLTLVDKMRASKQVEEQLRPDLPALVRPDTWVSRAKDLMDTQPEIYAGIVNSLADGESVAQLAKRTGFEIQLVRKIRELHPEVIEAGSKAVLSRLGEALHNGSERLANEMDSIPIASLPIAVAVLVDKVQLLSGGATQRIEKINAASPEDLRAMFDALPEANARVIEEIQE